MLDPDRRRRSNIPPPLEAAHRRVRETPNVSTLPIARRELRGVIERALPGCRRETSESLAAMAHLRSVSGGGTIFSQGEPIPLTLVIRGHGAFRRTTIEGKQIATGIGIPGNLYGFSSIAGTRSSVEFVALTDCDVAMWSGRALRGLAMADPGFALDAIDHMAGFINMLAGNLEGFMHQDARRRVVRVLARHRDLFFAEPPVLSRSLLPSLVGTSREMTGRVLRALEREGTVARVGRTGLKLLRPDQLEADEAPPTGSRPPMAPGPMATAPRTRRASAGRFPG